MVDVPVTRQEKFSRAGRSQWLRAALTHASRTLAVAASDAASQRRNFILWPFALIGGLILYRVLPSEPDLRAIAALLLAALVLVACSRNSPTMRQLAPLALVLCIGTTVLPAHGLISGTPMLETPRYGTYAARINAVVFDDGQQQRWILSDIANAADARQDWTVPDIRRARVLVRETHPVSSGDRVTARIRFYPVPPPAVPGGYDSQFVSYFSGIGAYGNVLGDVVVEPVAPSGPTRVVDDIRAAVTARLVGQLGDRVGGIATALITGDRSRISEEDYGVLAEAGIVHVIAISGLHLTLVAGTMFFCVRFLLALGHGLAQRLPIKKVAAVFGIITALAYMLLSGMVIPAVRATIMLSLVFAAIIAGRQALTMRNVAIAALVIIIVEPTSVFRASFQLSFAAVVALIAGYELVRRGREDRPATQRSLLVRHISDVSMTSIIAGLATLVFTAYHFQQTAPFGLLGNLMVTPIVSLVMMPAALFGTLLLPLGLDAPFYAALGWSIEAMLWSAYFVRTISGGFDPSPILAPTALVVALLALAGLAYFRGRIRLLAPILAVPLIALFCLEKRPDILIADQSQAVAIRNGDGYALMAGRSNTFSTNVWSERFITQIEGRDERASCDSLGCLLTTDEDYTVALVRSRDAFAEDCHSADIVLSRITAPAACRSSARLVIDADDLTRYGVHLVNWNGIDASPTVRTAIDSPYRVWRVGVQ